MVPSTTPTDCVRISWCLAATQLLSLMTRSPGTTVLLADTVNINNARPVYELVFVVSTRLSLKETCRMSFRAIIPPTLLRRCGLLADVLASMDILQVRFFKFHRVSPQHFSLVQDPFGRRWDFSPTSRVLISATISLQVNPPPYACAVYVSRR